MIRSLMTSMLCVLTLAAVARAQGSSPSTIQATWVGRDADIVNKGSETKPDGEMDGHFRIETSFPSRREIAYLALRSADPDGNPAGGQVWHTRDSGNWILGVVDGQRMNARHVTSLGKFIGPVEFNLYAGDSGWFNAGKTFVFEIGLDGNEVLEAVVRIGEAAGPLAGAPQAGGAPTTLAAGAPSAAPTATAPVPADWNTRAQSHHGEVGTRYSYTCPPNGTVGPVWGTDVYTDDTSVCTAAVHAGLITLVAGGAVTIEMRGGESAYRGEPRNGVTSWNYGAWESSFVFPRPGDSPATPAQAAGGAPAGGVQTPTGGAPGAGAPTAGASAPAGQTSPTVEGGAPTPLGGSFSRLTSFQGLWIGQDADVVGNGPEVRPDGSADGHFRVDASFSFWQDVTYVALYSADEAGNKAGGQVWHTRDAGNWILAVLVDGMNLNTRHIPLLGAFRDDVTFDLYAGDSGWFRPGQTLLVEIGLDGGSPQTRLVRIGGGPPAAEAPPAGEALTTPVSGAPPSGGAPTQPGAAQRPPNVQREVHVAYNASWVGMDADHVSQSGSATPDGSPDGHFTFTYETDIGPYEIRSITVMSSDSAGHPAGGLVWTTASSRYWVLGVIRQGVRLNDSQVSTLGTHQGFRSFDLYAADSGWFQPGRYFVVEVDMGGGTPIRQVVRIPESFQRDAQPQAEPAAAEVPPDEEVPIPMPMFAGSISLGRSTYGDDEPVRVTFRDFRGDERIVVAYADADPVDYITGVWPNGTPLGGLPPDKPTQTGSVAFIGLYPGEYEVRVFTGSPEEGEWPQLTEYFTVESAADEPSPPAQELEPPDAPVAEEPPMGAEAARPPSEEHPQPPSEEYRVTGLTVAWIGMDADVVSNVTISPDGALDGHFAIDLTIEGSPLVSYATVYSSDASGNPSGGQIWHTQSSSYAVLAVSAWGHFLNDGYVGEIGRFSAGATRLDLYAYDSGWFRPGQHFVVELGFADGQKVARVVQVTEAAVPPAAEEPAAPPANQYRVTGLSATWIGIDADVVSNGTATTPDGGPDARFVVEIAVEGSAALRSVTLYSSDAQGNPEGGHVWTTASGTSWWVLGVGAGGRLLHNGQVEALGMLQPGTTSLDLFAGNSGWFNPGQSFLVELAFADGQKAAAVVQVTGAAPAPPVGPPPAAGGDTPGATGIEWGRGPMEHRGQNGQRFTYVCPPNGSPSTIWGTGIYTDDSSVCTAAVHAGLITIENGGPVTIEIRPGQSSYTGSPGYGGVTSGNWGAYEGSFLLVGDASTAPGTQYRVTGLSASWIGMDADAVPNASGAAMPDGAADGHFAVEIAIEGSVELRSVTLSSSDAHGNPSGGQIWNTGSGNWILGVAAGGQLLHAGPVETLGTLQAGTTRVDLYAGNSGWFNPGQSFVVELAFADGQKAAQVVRIPDSFVPPGAAPPVTPEGQAAGGAPGACDVSGLWHGNIQGFGASDWTFTATGRDLYAVQETGLGYAQGTATVSGYRLQFDWRTGDFTGTAVLDLDASCTSASGQDIIHTGSPGTYPMTLQRAGAAPPVGGGEVAGQVFSAPTWNGLRVDICLVWAGQCGEPAASEFCRRSGYLKAIDWQPAHDIGAQTPTVVLGTGETCADGHCDGFASITCSSSP